MSTDQQVHTVRLGQNVCQRSMAMSDVATYAHGIFGEKHSQHVLLISQKSSCTHSILFHVQTQIPSIGLWHPVSSVCIWGGGGMGAGCMHTFVGGGREVDWGGGDWTCAYIPGIRPHRHVDIKQCLPLSLCFCLHLHGFCQHTAQWNHPSVTIARDSVNTPSLTIVMDSVNTPSLTIPRDSVNIHHRETLSHHNTHGFCQHVPMWKHPVSLKIIL